MWRVFISYFPGLMGVTLLLFFVTDCIFGLPFLYIKEGYVIKESYVEDVVNVKCSNHKHRLHVCSFSYIDEFGYKVNVDNVSKYKIFDYHHEIIPENPELLRNSFAFSSKNSFIYKKLQDGIVYRKIIPNGVILLLALICIPLEGLIRCSITFRFKVERFRHLLLFLGYDKGLVDSYIDHSYADFLNYKSFKKYIKTC